MASSQAETPQPRCAEGARISGREIIQIFDVGQGSLGIGRRRYQRRMDERRRCHGSDETV